MPTYIKLDDTCPDHPSIVGLTDAAFACWVRCLCYSSRHLTDGRIPTTALRTLGSSKAVKELRTHGRLQDVDGGVLVHGYTEKQRTREQVEAEREKWRKRAAKSRGHSPEESTRDTPPGHAGVTQQRERESESESERQQPPSPPATDAVTRKARLAAAAELIGERAAGRPGVRDPDATRAAVARAVVRDRFQEAYAHLTEHPDTTPIDLAQHLEPATLHLAGPVLPPISAPEHLADFDHHEPARLDDDQQASNLAHLDEIRKQRRPPEPAA